MDEQEVEIEITAEGKVIVRTKGIKGPECVKVAELFASFIGKVESREDRGILRRCGNAKAPGRRPSPPRLKPSETSKRSAGRSPMECPSCHFHNMPGSRRCLKCGGRLDAAAQAIAVEPPRASARTKCCENGCPAGDARLTCRVSRNRGPFPRFPRRSRPNAWPG